MNPPPGYVPRYAAGSTANCVWNCSCCFNRYGSSTLTIATATSTFTAALAAFPAAPIAE